MTDLRHLLERQAEWQKTRRSLSWPEKIRMVEAMQDAIRQFRGMLSMKTRRPTDISMSKPALQDEGSPNVRAKVIDQQQESNDE